MYGNARGTEAQQPYNHEYDAGRLPGGPKDERRVSLPHSEQLNASRLPVPPPGGQ